MEDEVVQTSLIDDIEETIEIEEKNLPYENKDRKLVTQPYDMSIQTVVEQIKHGDIFLEPDYQRNYRWDPIKASKFIESLLLNIPIPNIFLAEEEDITYTVIDGQQRLSSIRNFIDPENETDRIILRGLQVRSELNGKSYNDLDKKDQGKLKKQYLRCSVILNDSDPQIKFDVFERLNTGSEKLQPQEIRNCTYRGNFNELLKRLAKNKKFLTMLKLNNSKSKDMTDVEYVLRFFAYAISLVDYKGSVSEFLNMFMKANQHLSEEKLMQFEDLFKFTIDGIYDTYGEKAFKRYVPEKDSWYPVTNRAIFDAQMVAFSQVDMSFFSDDQKNKLVEDTKIIMQDQEFIDTIERTTNLTTRVETRINYIKRMLIENGGRVIES